MFLLASLLAFGWPKVRIDYLPAHDEITLISRRNLLKVRVNPCCGSMRPHLQGGEWAFVELYDGHMPLLGRVVGTKRFLHQVVAETPTHIYTSGTNNRHSDGWSPKTDIQYVLRYVIKG